MSHFGFIEGSKSIQSLSNPHPLTGSFLGLFVFAVLYEDSSSVSVIIIVITSIINIHHDQHGLLGEIYFYCNRCFVISIAIMLFYCQYQW